MTLGRRTAFKLTACAVAGSFARNAEAADATLSVWTGYFLLVRW